MMSDSQLGQITRWVIVAFAVIVLCVAIWLVRDILMLTLTAVIFAMLMTTPVRFLVRSGMRRSMAVLLSIMLFLIVIVLITALLLPGLLDQFRQLVVVLQKALRPGQLLISDPTLDSTQLSIILRRALQPNAWIATPDILQGIDLSDVSKQISAQVFGGVANITSQVFPFVGSLASVLLSILVVVFMGMYFVADPGTYERGLLRLIPISYRARAQEILRKMELALRSFLQAQIILMLLTGLSTSITLALLGIPLAGALGTITGLFSFVPNFGPLVALIPIIAVVIINVPSKILSVIAVFYAVQLIQSQLIAPLLVGQEIHLPPVVILLSQIIAGIFFGFLGLLLSVPLAAIIMVLIREIYIKDILGDGTGIADIEIDLMPERT